MVRSSVLVGFLVACGEEDPGPLAIAGAYTDAFGTAHEITDTSWTQTFGSGTTAAAYAFAITSYDNVEQYLIAENGADNGYFPGLWSRFDWTDVDGDLFYCQSAFDAATEEDAFAAPRADDTDPASGGCGGFAWTALSAR